MQELKRVELYARHKGGQLRFYPDNDLAVELCDELEQRWLNAGQVNELMQHEGCVVEVNGMSED